MKSASVAALLAADPAASQSNVIKFGIAQHTTNSRTTVLQSTIDFRPVVYSLGAAYRF
jgi:hypothetical protein